MRDFRDAKLMAQTLRETLSAKNIPIGHGECLELVARQFGLADWNTLSARIQAAGAAQGENRKFSISRGDLNSWSSGPQPIKRGMKFPLLPLRDAVFFPQMTAPIGIKRERTIRAVEDAINRDGRLFLVAQRNHDDENPAITDLYPIGVVATVVQGHKEANRPFLPWMVRGEHRARILHATTTGGFTMVEIAPMAMDRGDGDQARTLAPGVREQFLPYAKAHLSPIATALLPGSEDASGLANAIASWLLIELAEKQDLLETNSVARRLEKIAAILSRDRAAA